MFRSHSVGLIPFPVWEYDDSLTAYSKREAPRKRIIAWHGHHFVVLLDNGNHCLEDLVVLAKIKCTESKFQISTSEFFVHNALMPCPTGSRTGWHFVLNFERFDCQVVRANETQFSQSSTNVLNVILSGKVPFEIRPFFFGAK